MDAGGVRRQDAAKSPSASSPWGRIEHGTLADNNRPRVRPRSRNPNEMDPLVRGGEPSLSRINLIRDRVRVRARVLDLKCECYSALMDAVPPELTRESRASGHGKTV